MFKGKKQLSNKTLYYLGSTAGCSFHCVVHFIVALVRFSHNEDYGVNVAVAVASLIMAWIFGLVYFKRVSKETIKS